MNVRGFISRVFRSAVARNYSHLTIANIAAMVISFCIYPFVIRTLGGEQYGLYVFAFSVMSYFVDVVAFGLNMPSVRMIVEAEGDKPAVDRVVSGVMYVRGFFMLVSVLVFAVMVFALDRLSANRLLYFIVFLQLLNTWLLPKWYFQARQQMQYVTYPAVVWRLISVPFILLFVSGPDDLIVYSLISTATVLVSLVHPLWQMFVVDRVKLVGVSFSSLRAMVKDGTPFFVSGIVGSIREETATILIGIFLGMRDVALYDLARKVVSLPRLLIQNINQALFPDAIKSGLQRIQKIMVYEWLIGIAMMVGVAVLGYWAVVILGGHDMVDACPVAIILSVTVLTWLVVGGYIALIFVPNGHYTLVSTDQIVSFVVFLCVALPLLYVYGNVYSMAIAVSVSGIAEVVYCWIYARRIMNKLTK